MGSVDAVSAKTARECDVCVRKRARWYCAADDAFLCQSCDDSVHSANTLARRHDRLRLNINTELPSWHRGPTKKPRTPRHRKKKQQSNHLMVPELDTCSTSMEDDEEHLLYRVPVYGGGGPAKEEPSDFDADVEALLGKGLDGDHMSLLFERKELDDDSTDQLGIGEAPFELTFDYEYSPIAYHDVKVASSSSTETKMLLRLDYDAISRAWGSQGSPWINGGPPPGVLTTTGGCGTEVKACGDGEREARVSRYREKRRTRMFSKKIRYEVRKLNAEKRPRMKGRFVKRSSFPLLAK